MNGPMGSMMKNIDQWKARQKSWTNGKQDRSHEPMGSKRKGFFSTNPKACMSHGIKVSDLFKLLSPDISLIIMFSLEQEER